MRWRASSATVIPGGASPRKRELVRGRTCGSSLAKRPDPTTARPRRKKSGSLRPARSGHARIRRHARRHEGVTSDDGAPSDYGLAAEDRRVRVDHHVVLDRRVPPLPRLWPRLALRHAERAERDALVDANAIADQRGLA